MKRFMLMRPGIAHPVCQVEVADKPLKSTLDAWAAMGGDIVEVDITAEYAERKCQEDRRREYPPIEELADALFHQHYNGEDGPLLVYLEKVAAVKARFPKPGGATPGE